MQADRNAGCRSGSQVTEAEVGGPSRPTPGSPAPPSGGTGGNAPTAPGQNFPGPLGELWCLFTLKREGEKKAGKESGKEGEKAGFRADR